MTAGRARHTVRVTRRGQRWDWVREAGNRVQVAQSIRLWPMDRRRDCVAAARAEAVLTGARLIVDGHEVQP